MQGKGESVIYAYVLLSTVARRVLTKPQVVDPFVSYCKQGTEPAVLGRHVALTPLPSWTFCGRLDKILCRSTALGFGFGICPLIGTLSSFFLFSKLRLAI